MDESLITDRCLQEIIKEGILVHEGAEKNMPKFFLLLCEQAWAAGNFFAMACER
jgi:hypothetical protein